MPFTITIKINSQEVVHIKGRNCGPPDGDDYEKPTRLYSYVAENKETNTTKEGTVYHQRPEGIEKLTGVILMDLAAKSRSFR